MSYGVWVIVGYIRRSIEDRLAVHDELPGLGLEEAQDDVNQCGFASSGCTDEADLALGGDTD